MQITLNLPDSLSQTDTFNQSDWLREIVSALFQQNILLIEQAAQIIGMDVDDFYQILVDRSILTPPPSDPDDNPNDSSLPICESP